MKIIADLHIHSKYSRAVSRDMTLENIDLWARKKGIGVMGTGDFTHPLWFREIREKLEPVEPGLYKLKERFLLKNGAKRGDSAETRFILTTEIANIYSKEAKTRRIHNLIFAPSVEAAGKINSKLQWIGNLKADGRPMLGLDSKRLLRIALDADQNCVLIPAHAWTPWFSIFGSMSGFDSIEECFDEMSSHIFAIETGLSSDPAMNWRLSKLDEISLISNSDSHSLQKIGREANVFDCDLSYDAIIKTIKSRDPEKFLFTLEFFPEEGKYHYTGHRDCGFSQGPKGTKANSGICPKCGKKLTIGVMDRVEKLADRDSDSVNLSKGKVPYRSMIPLQEIIADALGVGAASKSVANEYEKLIGNLENEFNVLLNASEGDIAKFSNSRIAEGVARVRERKVNLVPGYDGEYGKISIFSEENQPSENFQTSLF
jgi:uncharacterized protein (TIGR00375 family)